MNSPIDIAVYRLYMTLKTSVIIGTIILMMISVSNAHAVTNSTSNVGVPLAGQIANLIENPFFAPDGSCLFDAYQLHCIPGDHQECPEGFGNNEDDTCFPMTMVNGTWEWECPNEYHSAQDDETGQCYPDTEPCWPGQVRNQTDPNDSSCSDETIVCGERNYNKTGCVIKSSFPNTSCLTSPDSDRCNMPSGGCPDEFVQMNSQNFSSPKCVPEDRDEHEFEERYRQVYDPNRCAKGYELKVPDNQNVWRSQGSPIGTCDKED